MPLSNIEILKELNICSILLRLVLAMIIGGIIGLERETKGRAAGLRTYMLVCVGSALVMITNQYISLYIGPSDPARFGAQVISGIGFLGAGTIILTRRNHVIGLTTAAGLWSSACIGLAVGIGFYEGAIIACVFILFIIAIMHRIERFSTAKTKSVELYVELCEGARLSALLRSVRENDLRIIKIDFTQVLYAQNNNIAVLLSLRLPKGVAPDAAAEIFAKQQSVFYVEKF